MTRYQSEAEQKILDIIEAARKAMTDPNGMTDSDLQGVVAAFVLTYVKP